MKLQPFAICRLVLFVSIAALLCGCVGRAQSDIAYNPPGDHVNVQQTAILPCNIKQAQLVITRYFEKTFSTQAQSSSSPSELIFKFAMPDDELQKNLDCGLLTVHSPSVDNISKWSVYEKRITPTVNDKTLTFVAASPLNKFMLADGTSTPKPAQIQARAAVTVTVSLAPHEKDKTLLTMRTAYVMDISLIRWVMISGFSPAMPERLSALFEDKAQLKFEAGDVGTLSEQLFRRRREMGINGDWPIQCVSTGTLESRVINAIITMVSAKGGA